MTLQQPMQDFEIAPPSPAQILESMQHPVLVVDAAGEIVYANAAAAASFGGWVVGMKMTEIFCDYTSPVMDSDSPAAMRLVSRWDKTYDAQLSPMGCGNRCVSLWPVVATIGEAFGIRADDLTGLALRNAFMNELALALAAATQDCEVAVLCLDLDRFKLINDTLGHGIGDELLKKVADRLRKVSRKEDLVARLGGDEFVILQRGVGSPADAERLAERVVDLVGRTYVINGHTVNIGASVGVAIGRAPLQARDLVRNADLALYEAKRAGRSRYRFFECGMDILLRERRELEIDLRRALALKQFALQYQPFIDLKTDRVMGFEALLRWTHPVRGNVPPLEFISVAEENGLIVKLGEWVLNTACMAAASWPSDLVVAVNVSPVQLRADTLLSSVWQALERSGLAPERLEIEITESALLDDADNALTTLRALRGRGVRISMDDFGTGYSSLSYLQKFPFDKIKIDRSFVTDADADSLAILKAVSELGNSLGMSITAEGVETADQLERVRDLSCTHVQGYLTGRPMTVASVNHLLANRG